MGISQRIPGILPICNRAKNKSKTAITGCPFFCFESGKISLAPKKRTTPINAEKIGILEKESPKYIIANKEGIPNRFISVLEELFFAIIALKQDKKFTRILHLIPKGLMNSLSNKKPGSTGLFYYLSMYLINYPISS